MPHLSAQEPSKPRNTTQFLELAVGVMILAFAVCIGIVYFF